MAQLPTPPLDNPCYPFYVQDIGINIPLQKLRFQPNLRIDFTRENLTINYVSLFSRPVVYLSLSHQTELADVITHIRGFYDYLSGCASLLLLKDLMNYIPREKIGTHNHDLQEAFNLLIKSANDHFPPAQYLIGYCYLHGFKIARGSKVEKNKDVAINWFKSAAAYGHALSIHCLREIQALSMPRPLPNVNPPQPPSHTPQPIPIAQARGYEEYEALIIGLMRHNQTIFYDNTQLRKIISELTQKIISLESLLNARPPIQFINQTPTQIDPDVQNSTIEENEPKRQRISPTFFD